MIVINGFCCAIIAMLPTVGPVLGLVPYATFVIARIGAGAARRIRLQGDLPKDYPLADHDTHARSVAADAYWKQIRRTVNGEPVDEAQIGLIVNAITDALSLRRDDLVLDLACGNGALS